MRAIRKYRRDFIAILLLGVIAGLTAAVILPNERFRFPWEPAPFVLKAAFSTGQAVTPGQGQTVRVSGIRIGDLSHVALVNGHAVVTMDIDPTYRNLIHTDATALLRPKTGLKDMFVELNPGTHAAPIAKENWTLPIQNTLPDVNADEVYSALDADTRDYLGLLINGAGQGLKGRGGDLRQVFMRFEPTHRDLARVSTAVAQRNAYLRRLITSLHVLNHELATRQNDVASLIDASSVVFHAFASEDTQISRAIGDFPGALSQTTDTLNKVTTFANVLGPTSDALRPAVRALNGANLALVPFANATTPVLKNQIRPFIRDARPLVRSLRPASINLAKATPDLTSVFGVLNHLFNMLAYNPNTSNAAYNGANAASYLFWLAWVSHDGTNLFSTADANGPFRPVALGLTCQSIFNQLQQTQGQDPSGGLTAITTLAENLTPLLAAGGVCGH